MAISFPSAVEQVLRPYSARSIALGATVLLALCGAVYIAYLRLVPSDIHDQSLRWPVYDKRWLLALFGLSVACIYAPRAIARLVEDWRGLPVEPAVAIVRARRIPFWARLTVAVLIGFAIALADGLPLLTALQRRTDIHELVHLTPLLKILRGGVPFVEARTQYGAGHQLLTYLVMTGTEFSLRGFRIWFFLSNIAIEGLKLGLLVLVLGFWRGLAAVVLSLLFMPLGMMQFSGWYVLVRWFDPLVVGLVMPLIVWHQPALRTSLISIAALGAASGCLAIVSQENFSTGLVTGCLILVAAFGLGRLSVREALALLGAFASCHILVFVGLMAAIVGTSNLGLALGYAFALGGHWAKGLANTPWSSPSSPWTTAFYASPPLVLALSAITLYSRRQLDARLERHRGQLVGMAAASASLIPITLLRSDEAHFIGPAMTLPALIALAVLTVPALLTGRPLYRESIRAIMIVFFAVIYLLPLGMNAIATRLTPDLPGAMRGIAVLRDFATTMGERDDPFLFDRRAGIALREDAICCQRPELTLTQFRARLEEIKRVVGARPTFIDLSWPGAGMTYFFADLTLTDAPPELAMTLWLRSDLEELKATLASSPPECVLFGESEFDASGQPTATAKDRFGMPTFLVGLLDRPTVTPLKDGGTVWCQD